jgi:hypothetical protein
MGIRRQPVTAPALSVTVTSERQAHATVDVTRKHHPGFTSDVPSVFELRPRTGGRTPVTSNPLLKQFEILYIVGTFTSSVPAKSPPCEGNPRLTAIGDHPAEQRSSA